MGHLLCAALAELDCLDWWITPFVRVTDGVPAKSRLRRRVAAQLDTGLPVTAQLLGTRPDVMAESARRLLDVGAVGINLNFACPSKDVVGSGGGGAVLKSPDLLREITETVAAAIHPAPLSLKLRAGFESPDEMESIARACVGSGADFAVFHFRTVREGYRQVVGGPVRAGRFAAACAPLPVVANGDVKTLDDAMGMRSAGIFAGIAVGRGLLADPGLLRRIEFNSAEAAPSPMKIRATLFESMLERSAELTHKARMSCLLELARMAYGVRHPVFDTLLKTSIPEEFPLELLLAD